MDVPESIKNLVKEIVKSDNTTNYDIVLHESNKKGEGFMGEIVFFSVVDSDTKKVVLDLVLKNSLKSVAVRNAFSVRLAFLNEINFYENVWPQLDNFRQQYKVEPIMNVARCYGTSTKEMDEYVLLENLKSQGFKMFDKNEFMNLNQFKYILRQYGKFHALSFAFRKQKPNLFADAVGGYRSMFDNPMSGFQQSIDNVCKVVYSYLRPEDTDAKTVFKKYEDDGWKVFVEALKYNGPNGVILHGDCWNNNMMFKFDNDTFSDMALVDFQISRVGSPVYDLSYCLYAAATKDILDKLDELLDEYFNSLKQMLLLFGENVDDIYPYTVFKDEWRRYSKANLIFSFVIWKVRTRTPEEMIDFNDFVKDKKNITVPKSELFKTITRNLVLHACEINAL